MGGSSGSNGVVNAHDSDDGMDGSAARTFPISFVSHSWSLDLTRHRGDARVDHRRRHTASSAYPSPVLSVSSPLASKQPLPPPAPPVPPAPPSLHAMDVSEEQMPPKMRKNWIHKSSEALRDSYANAGSGSGTPSSSSSASSSSSSPASGNAGIVASHAESSALGSSSGVEHEEMDVDEETLGTSLGNLFFGT